MDAVNNQTNEFILCDCKKFYVETWSPLVKFFKSPFQYGLKLAMLFSLANC